MSDPSSYPPLACSRGDAEPQKQSRCQPELPSESVLHKKLSLSGEEGKAPGVDRQGGRGTRGSQVKSNVRTLRMTLCILGHVQYLSSLGHARPCSLGTLCRQLLSVGGGEHGLHQDPGAGPGGPRLRRRCQHKRRCTGRKAPWEGPPWAFLVVRGPSESASPPRRQ